MTAAGGKRAVEGTIVDPGFSLPEAPIDLGTAVATSPAPAGPPAPVPFLEGSFALYSTPDGSVVMAYRTKGEEQVKHLHIPAFILTMAGQASGMEPSQIMDKIRAGDFGG